jgi:hypothetical protein
VRVISLRGGAPTELTSFYAYEPAFIGGVHVAAADTTGDGVAEIITGAGAFGGPHVRVIGFDSGTLTELTSFYAYDPAFVGGVSVAGGDVTGDGIAEVITGAELGGGPHVRAIDLSGGTLTEISSFYAYDPAFVGGVHVAAAETLRDGEVARVPAQRGGRAVNGPDGNGILRAHATSPLPADLASSSSAPPDQPADRRRRNTTRHRLLGAFTRRSRRFLPPGV